MHPRKEERQRLGSEVLRALGEGLEMLGQLDTAAADDLMVAALWEAMERLWACEESEADRLADQMDRLADQVQALAAIPAQSPPTS